MILLATFAPLVERPRDPPPRQAWVEYRPVPLDRTDPRRRTVGALTLLEGWQLTSNDRRFGGISAMQVQGRELLAFSDAGSVIAAPLPSGPGRVPATVGALPQGPGSASRKGDRDVEAIATLGPLLWTGYERNNQVWRYDRRSWRAASAARPPGMKDWDDNRGAEAMLRLPDGRFLVFAEGPGGLSEVLLFAGDPAVKGTRAERLLYRPPEGFRITDATMLPDGRMLFLNRRLHLFHGLGAKLTVAPLSAVKAGAVIAGRELADLRPPLIVDNMEALSVTVENGRTIVWMASDDNFGPLQKTLLLKFALGA
jgi:hypothetical protein